MFGILQRTACDRQRQEQPRLINSALDKPYCTLNATYYDILFIYFNL